MSLTVRPVTRADYDHWLPLWEGYNAFYKRVGPTAVPLAATNLTGKIPDAQLSTNVVLLSSNVVFTGSVRVQLQRQRVWPAQPTCHQSYRHDTGRAAFDEYRPAQQQRDLCCRHQGCSS